MTLVLDFLFLMFQHSDLLSMSLWRCWNLFFCDYWAMTKLNFDGIDDNLFHKEIHKMMPIHSDYAKGCFRGLSDNTAPNWPNRDWYHCTLNFKLPWNEGYGQYKWYNCGMNLPKYRLLQRNQKKPRTLYFRDRSCQKQLRLNHWYPWWFQLSLLRPTETARMWKLKYKSIHWLAASGGAGEWKLPEVIARKVFAIRISKVWFVLFSWPKADGRRLSWCRLHFEQQSRI